MGGITKVGSSGVDALRAQPDLEAAETALPAPDVSQADTARAADQGRAHASDLGSSILRASLDGAKGAEDVDFGQDYFTLEQFYEGLPGEIRTLDTALDKATSCFPTDGAAGTDAAKAIQQEARGQILLSSMVELAAELRKSPLDLAGIQSAAGQADKAFLDYASKGDEKARAIMARAYGSSMSGGGAFGNHIAEALQRHMEAAYPPVASQSGAAPSTSPASQTAPSIPAPPAPAPTPISGPASQTGASPASQTAPSAPPATSPASQSAPSPASQTAPAPAPSPASQTAPSAPPAGSPASQSAGQASQTGPAEGPADTDGTGGPEPAGYASLDAARNGSYVKKGSRGPEVEALQRALNQAGIQPPLEVDGAFGPATEAAVRRFQQQQGITSDGIVGPQTMGAMDRALGLSTRTPGGGQGPGQVPGGGATPPPPSVPATPTITPPGPGAPGGDVRRAALASARTQLGVREASGNNDGVPAQRYSNGRNVAWCANFVSWNFRQAGNPLPGNQSAIGSCDTMANELKRAGMWIGKSTPQPGDVIFFGTPNDYTHVGIVDRVENGRVHTVEGNSGNRVAERSYPLSDPRITGYGRPT